MHAKNSVCGQLIIESILSMALIINKYVLSQKYMVECLYLYFHAVESHTVMHKYCTLKATQEL